MEKKFFTILFIGTGATLIMDLWALLLKQFGIPSLNFKFLGRWVGHIPEGKFKHQKISEAPPIKGEGPLGWITHYAIGISIAGLLIAVFGFDWAESPTIIPALVIGLTTVAAPLLILQPALGFGIASSKTPRPLFNSLKSVTTHFIFGIGLYLSAKVLQIL